MNFAGKMSATKRVRIQKTVELADFTEKNAKRICIPKTVELADFIEKNVKRICILKTVELAENKHSENGRVGRLLRGKRPKEYAF